MKGPRLDGSAASVLFWVFGVGFFFFFPPNVSLWSSKKGARGDFGPSLGQARDVTVSSTHLPAPGGPLRI